MTGSHQAPTKQAHNLREPRIGFGSRSGPYLLRATGSFQEDSRRDKEMVQALSRNCWWTSMDARGPTLATSLASLPRTNPALELQCTRAGDLVNQATMTIRNDTYHKDKHQRSLFYEREVKVKKAGVRGPCMRLARHSRLEALDESRYRLNLPFLHNSTVTIYQDKQTRIKSCITPPSQHISVQTRVPA
jgi:hypothetical protein